MVGRQSGAERFDLSERSVRALEGGGKGLRVNLRAKALQRPHALITHGLMLSRQIAPPARVARQTARFTTDVRSEEKRHIRVRARAERYCDEGGAAMDLRHNGRGDQLAFGCEGAGVFEAPEPIPELKRLGRALAHCAHAADPGRFARHKAEMTDDRNLLVGENFPPFRCRGSSAPHQRPR